MTVVVIGLGSMGRRRIRLLKSFADAPVVVGVNRNPERRAEAARELGISVPLIVRLEGTNADKGKEILRASGLSIIAAGSMAEGAKLAIGAAK